MLPDPTLSLGHPFLFRYSLSFLTHPLKSTHIHTDTTPLLRQQVKQNNSLCHTIAPLPRSRHWLLYSMTFPPLSLFSAPSSSLVLYFFFHTIVTLLQQEPVMVNCLTFLIVWWCCAVWSCVDLFQPHTSRGVCYCGHLCLVGIGGVVCVLQVFVLTFVSIWICRNFQLWCIMSTF